MIETLRDKLKSPLIVQAGSLPAEIIGARSTGTLARDGETGEGQISKRSLWEALQNCKDPQLYSSDISIVELGLVQDIKVKNGEVNVVLTMPHRGRPLASYFMYGSSSVQQGPGTGKVSLTIPEALSRVPGVKKVTMTQSWYPVWNSNYITDEGRGKLGI
jgi:metal-sulfur cluster biosynthetic enzyme